MFDTLLKKGRYQGVQSRTLNPILHKIRADQSSCKVCGFHYLSILRRHGQRSACSLEDPVSISADSVEEEERTVSAHRKMNDGPKSCRRSRCIQEPSAYEGNPLLKKKRGEGENVGWFGHKA